MRAARVKAASWTQIDTRAADATKGGPPMRQKRRRRIHSERSNQTRDALKSNQTCLIHRKKKWRGGKKKNSAVQMIRLGENSSKKTASGLGNDQFLEPECDASNKTRINLA